MLESLFSKVAKSKVTENIFNLQEWHQNTKTFISYKTFTVGKKLKHAKNDQIWLVVAWYRFFIRQIPFLDDHFLVVPRVVILYRFDFTPHCPYWTIAMPYLNSKKSYMYSIYTCRIQGNFLAPHENWLHVVSDILWLTCGIIIFN